MICLKSLALIYSKNYKYQIEVLKKLKNKLVILNLQKNNINKRLVILNLQKININKIGKLDIKLLEILKLKNMKKIQKYKKIACKKLKT